MNFSSDAGLLPFQLNVGTDQVLLVSLSEADYREASFLDNRLLAKRRPMQWVDWSWIDQASASIEPTTQFIFHIGHVGSTLLARLLGELDSVLAVREPQVMRQLAELWQLDGEPHSPWAPGVAKAKLASFNRWFARGFRSGQSGIVKASSFASDLATDLLSKRNRAVFLYLRPERYIQTILGGEASRQELGMLAGPRMERLHSRLGETPFQLWSLGEAERAALSWACEMSALEAATGEHVLWIDFDQFLASPADHLVKAARFLGHAITEEQAGSLTSGPIMTQYSKAPEHGYSTQLREEVLADAARQRASDIRGAMEWLEKAGNRITLIGKALERSNQQCSD